MCIDSKAVFVIGAFFAILGGILLCILMGFTVRPYEFAKDFDKTTCTSEGYVSCKYTKVKDSR